MYDDAPVEEPAQLANAANVYAKETEGRMHVKWCDFGISFLTDNDDEEGGNRKVCLHTKEELTCFQHGSRSGVDDLA